MATAHQSVQSQLPPLAYKIINTTTWGGTPNTATIADATVSENSAILIWVTGTTPPVGRWSYNITQSQIVITSSDAENTALPISYIVL